MAIIAHMKSILGHNCIATINELQVVIGIEDAGYIELSAGPV